MRSLSCSGLELELRRSLERGSELPLRVESATDGPQATIDADFLPLQSGRAGELRIWSNSQCIVASRAQTALPEFDAARTLSERAGWPVVMRRSGGSAVVHRPGILNVSVRRLMPPDSLRWVSQGYEAFLAYLICAFKLLGVECDAGEVPGAYCDGRFNLRIGGCKLAGTAAHFAIRDGARVCLFHAAILVSGSVFDDIAAIERFEYALGAQQRYAPEAHATLAQLHSLSHAAA
jgi:octanoyl-[GcvH]:protein N-octanoyltransferase